MCDPVSLDPSVRLILITGNPGASKTTIARHLICGLPEDWRLVTLDDFLLLREVEREDVWANARDRRNLGIPNKAVELYHLNSARVIIEGIVQTDDQVEAHCRAMGLVRNSPAVRFIELWCEEEEAVRRMKSRPLKEPGFSELKARGHYRGLTALLRATGALRIDTTQMSAEQALAAVVQAINVAGPSTPSTVED
jgi:chloramphenicol 3-O-phosphotransferase